MSVKLSPTAINGSTQGNWISAQIQLGFSPSLVVLSSLTLDGVGVDMNGPVSLDEAGQAMTVKFPRAPFANKESGDYDLVLLGVRTDGVPFKSTTALSVSGSKALSRLHGARRTGVVISFEQPEVATLDVIDLQGRVVGHLASGLMSGTQVHEWPRHGELVARGSYFVRLRRAHSTEVVKLFVLP